MNEKSYKIVSIIALILGAIGVTIGYAAFSNTLTITSSAEVRPDPSGFNVDFSSSSSTVATDPIAPSLSTTATGFSATNASINNTSSPVISNLKATFTEPGQTVTYNFYSYNAGQYIAYLNSITFSGSKTCTPATGTDSTMVASACTGITLSVKVGNETATTSTVDPISGHSLGIGSAEPVQVVISYGAGSARADGNFDVTLPDIILTYDSVD